MNHTAVAPRAFGYPRVLSIAGSDSGGGAGSGPLNHGHAPQAMRLLAHAEK